MGDIGLLGDILRSGFVVSLTDKELAGGGEQSFALFFFSFTCPVGCECQLCRINHARFTF